MPRRSRGRTPAPSYGRSWKPLYDTTDPQLADHLHRALTTWTIAAHEAGRYDRAPNRHRAAGDPAVPVVSFAPVLLLRERTRRSMLEALRAVALSIEQGAEPTTLLRAIMRRGR